MATKEATARIKINKLLEAAGWRFFAEGSATADFHPFTPNDGLLSTTVVSANA
jgi:hypothetical protein